MQRRQLLRAASAAATFAAASAPAFVRAQGSLQKFKFNLGWKVEATAAGFLLAQQRGYYKDAGLDVQIDTGNGSAAAISLVGSGAYDCASADLATLVEFNLNNPQAGLRAVAIQYDLNPNAILVRKAGPIKQPADLAGKSILGQPFNASRKLFPAFAKGAGVRSVRRAVGERDTGHRGHALREGRLRWRRVLLFHGPAEPQIPRHGAGADHDVPLFGLRHAVLRQRAGRQWPRDR